MSFNNYYPVLSRKSTTKEADDSTLEKTSRLVAWRTRINRLSKKAGSKITSKDFDMGQWSWVMEYYREKNTNLITSPEAKDTIYFSLMAREKESLPAPIASFAVHILYSKTSVKQTTSKVFKDMKMVCGSRQSFATLNIKAHDLDLTTPVTFGLEFIDLKSENAEDGKTHSIWDEEYTENIEDICPDILVNARDGSVNARRYVLASNSPVFKAMFSENWSQAYTVNINEMSIGACKAMLNMLDNKKKNNELRAHSGELLTAADKYDIVALKEACEASWCEVVGANTAVFEILQFARRSNLLKLEKTCLFYLMKMGLIYEFRVREDLNTFLREADRELIVLLSNSCLDA